MKTPAFWYKKNSVIAKILRPIAHIYQMITRLRKASQKAYIPGVPTICIGNVVVGGSGKTPTTIAFSSMLKSLGLHPHIISRGYKGKVNYTYRVTSDDHAEKVGDEAVLLSKAAPTWIGKTRIKSCKKAIKTGADVLLFDDGLQNKSFHKDISILVVDGEQGFGNGELFPAGPLRTKLAEGFEVADAMILIHSTKSVEKQIKGFKKPVFKASFQACLPLQPQKVIAFAGLGYPLKFKTYLESLGFQVVHFLSFPDHHGYQGKDLKQIQDIQSALQLPVLTTEKDIVKIKGGSIRDLHALPITLKVENEQDLITFLDEKLKAATLRANAS